MSVRISRRGLLAGVTAPLLRLKANGRPNVLFLLSDDQRFDTIHALGNSAIRTPSLDRLVKDGVTFTQSYVCNPICTPSRACLLTGRDDWATGVRWFGEAIRPELPIWPEVMEAQGYETFFTGKWHNDGDPAKRGFTKTRYVFPQGMGDHQMKFDDGGKPVSGFSSELFANAAIDYIKTKPDKPFFAMVAFTAPHDPRTPPPAYAAQYDASKMPLPKNFLPQHPFDNGELKIRDEELLPWPRTEAAVKAELAKYYAMITHLDSQVGRILDALETSGTASNTIVVFTSDNGLALGSHGLLGKMSMYDHSVRVPLVLRLPEKYKAGTRLDGMVYNYELLPTICDVCSIRPPEGLSKESLVPLWEEKKQKGLPEVYASYRDVQRMVRTRDWKLIWYAKAGKTQLFNMRDDPDELRDVAGDGANAGTRKMLASKLAAHMKQVGDPLAGSYTES